MRWIVLVRHAAVQADAAQPSTRWPLSDAGRAAARALARAPLWRDTARIFSSPELKTHETAQILAGPNGMTVTLVEDLREAERPTGGWFGDYPAAVAAWFARPREPTHGWEPPVQAQARIRACIDELRSWEHGPVAVCGHGLTLALYLAALTGGDPASIWPAITLPDVAVIDPGRRTILQPFGRWAVAGGAATAVTALAPTAWDADHRDRMKDEA